MQFCVLFLCHAASLHDGSVRLNDLLDVPIEPRRSSFRNVNFFRLKSRKKRDEKVWSQKTQLNLVFLVHWNSCSRFCLLIAFSTRWLGNFFSRLIEINAEGLESEVSTVSKGCVVRNAGAGVIWKWNSFVFVAGCSGACAFSWEMTEWQATRCADKAPLECLWRRTLLEQMQSTDTGRTRKRGERKCAQATFTAVIDGDGDSTEIPLGR